MRKPSQWQHKKFKKQLFKGSYARTKKGERYFLLASEKQEFVFESFQAAKKSGWTKS